jgi:hypothetical protein
MPPATPVAWRHCRPAPGARCCGARVRPRASCRAHAIVRPLCRVRGRPDPSRPCLAAPQRAAGLRPQPGRGPCPARPRVDGGLPRPWPPGAHSPAPLLPPADWGPGRPGGVGSSRAVVKPRSPTLRDPAGPAPAASRSNTASCSNTVSCTNTASYTCIVTQRRCAHCATEPLPRRIGRPFGGRPGPPLTWLRGDPLLAGPGRILPPRAPAAGAPVRCRPAMGRTASLRKPQPPAHRHIPTPGTGRATRRAGTRAATGCAGRGFPQRSAPHRARSVLESGPGPRLPRYARRVGPGPAPGWGRKHPGARERAPGAGLGSDPQRIVPWT